jgi:ribosomal protein S18 acetylase RimI-like enzyme
MMQMVEEEARTAGCSCVHLDTMSFQALSFYEKLGYRIFGVLNGYADGVSRYYLVKELK